MISPETNLGSRVDQPQQKPEPQNKLEDGIKISMQVTGIALNI